MMISDDNTKFVTDMHGQLLKNVTLFTNIFELIIS